MSMPEIIVSGVERDQAITDIIASVALEQTALSHILNAEGEKLQKIIATEDITAQGILDVNNSVARMVSKIGQLEMILQSKLELFGDALNETTTTTTTAIATPIP